MAAASTQSQILPELTASAASTAACGTAAQAKSATAAPGVRTRAIRIVSRNTAAPAASSICVVTATPPTRSSRPQRGSTESDRRHAGHQRHHGRGGEELGDAHQAQLGERYLESDEQRAQ